MTKKTDQNYSYKCPQCKKSIVWRASSPYRPFCSERCRLIDFGCWTSDAYTISEPDICEMPNTELFSES